MAMAGWQKLNLLNAAVVKIAQSNGPNLGISVSWRFPGLAV